MNDDNAIYQVEAKLWHPNLRNGKWYPVARFKDNRKKAEKYCLSLPKGSVRIVRIEVLYEGLYGTL